MGGANQNTMFEFIFSQPFYDAPRTLQFLALSAQGTVALLFAIGFMRLIGWLLQRRNDPGPVAPFFGAITTLYALFFAFHAAQIWSLENKAEVAFRGEITAIASLDAFLKQEELGLVTVRSHLARYAEEVALIEWKADKGKPSIHASHHLEELRQEFIRATNRLPVAIGNRIWSIFDDIIKKRDERLSVSEHSRKPTSWWSILLLGFLAQLAIGFVHADRPRAGVFALTLFACTSIAAYMVLTSAVDPFSKLDNMRYIQAVSTLVE